MNKIAFIDGYVLEKKAGVFGAMGDLITGKNARALGNTLSEAKYADSSIDDILTEATGKKLDGLEDFTKNRADLGLELGGKKTNTIGEYAMDSKITNNSGVEGSNNLAITGGNNKASRSDLGKQLRTSLRNSGEAKVGSASYKSQNQLRKSINTQFPGANLKTHKETLAFLKQHKNEEWAKTILTDLGIAGVIGSSIALPTSLAAKGKKDK